MSTVALEFFIVLLLILANGVFAMSEIAVLSSRRARLQQLAEEGVARAEVALALSKAPNHFLSTIQIGITLIGILTGVFSGATISEELAFRLDAIPLLAGYGEPIALGVVVLVIAYVSLVLGELAPKRLALVNPESIATLMAPPMQTLAWLAMPVVRVLSSSTDAVLWLFRVPAVQETSISQEEIKLLLRQGTKSGTFEELEQKMVESVFRLGDRKVSALMTPRPDIAWLDITQPEEELKTRIRRQPYSYFPVSDSTIEQVRGIVKAKDILARTLANEPIELPTLLRDPLYVPESMSALKVLELFKSTRIPVALVIDEYGILQGLVTVTDILEVITGIASDMETGEEPDAVARADGSWLMDGGMDVDRFKELMHVAALPAEEARYYQTLGGFVMMQLGQIPKAGEQFDWDGLHFEVIDMDGLRVDKVLVTPRPTVAPTALPEDDGTT